MGGPSFFKLKQDFVSGVTIDEAYPFDTATFANAATKQLSETAVGFNAGVDISHALSSSLGIGALIRYPCRCEVRRPRHRPTEQSRLAASKWAAACE